MRILLLCLIALALVATADGEGTHTPKQAVDEIGVFEAGDCPFSVPSQVTADCGFVTVPEARDPALADDTNTIRLAVARVRSTSAEPAPDPVVYLDGGPGVFTLAFAGSYIAEFSGLLAERDLILFDQRGIGESETSLACPEYGDLFYATLDADTTPEEELSLQLDIGLSCRERHRQNGANLAVYNSAASAGDVADIVRALGYERVNLIGVSYGTRLGLTIMRDYPQIVRSAALDSVFPPQVDSYSQLAPNADRAFNALFTACAADPICSVRHPDLQQTFYATVERLDAAPEIVTHYDFQTEQTYDVRVDGAFLINGLFNLLYSRGNIPDLPRAIYDAADGRYTTFMNDFFETLYFTTTYASLSMYYAVDCYEEMAFETDATFEAGLENLPPALRDNFREETAFYRQYCAAYQPATAVAIENEPVRSDIPTLLLSGGYDPITPPEWAADTARYLSNSTHVIFTELAHGVAFGHPCPMRMIEQFIAAPDQPVDTACASQIPPPF